MRLRSAHRRRALAVLAAAVVAVAIPGCASSSSRAVAVPTPPSTVTSSGKPIGPVPAGLQSYYAQVITWGDCTAFARTPANEKSYTAPGLQCARMQAPVDYTQPQGKQVSLSLLRRPASGTKTGSLVVNPGGPGGSGMDTAADLSSMVANSPLGEHFDLVGFDPRGVGASEPAVVCQTGPENDAQRKDVDVDTSPAGIAKTEQEEKDYVSKCAQRVSPD
ncbi:MAG: alpha/beta hydrolase, partial [Actinomycetota bacterium]|nr:alpha/beta hydrolase [Actinomycetota bacterium]